MVFFFAMSPAASAEDSGAGAGAGADADAVAALGSQMEAADPFGGATAAAAGWKGSKKKKGAGGGGRQPGAPQSSAASSDGGKQQQVPAEAADPADVDSCVDPDRPLLFMGRDKHENEDLIKYGLPHDVWFHVDKLSSAHVYLRMRRRENAAGEGLDNIGKRTLQECAQLTKANSIAGCKLSECDIKYTPWSNLRKGSDMDTGTIGFHDNKLVKNIRIKKDSEIVNRLTKTKVWRDVDFASDRERYDSIVRAEKREVDRQRRNQEKEEKLEREKAKEAMSYKTLFDGAEMKSTADIKETYETAQDYEDDFM